MEEPFHTVMCSEAAAWTSSLEPALFSTFFVHHLPVELTAPARSESGSKTTWKNSKTDQV